MSYPYQVVVAGSGSDGTGPALTGQERFPWVSPRPMGVQRDAWGPERSDAELMKGLLEGHPEAMDAIYHRYKTHLRSVILSVSPEETEAEDVLHEVFVKLWKEAERYRPEKGLRGFLVTMARRRALDRLRRRLAYRRATGRLEVHLHEEFNDRVRSTRGVFTDVGLEGLMRDLIRRLPEAQQEAVRLTFYEGLSPREIADQKALPLGTVKMRLKLARKKLFHQLVALGEAI